MLNSVCNFQSPPLQSSNHNNCLLLIFANSSLGPNVALAPVQRLFFPVLTFRRFEGIRCARQFFWHNSSRSILKWLNFSVVVLGRLYGWNPGRFWYYGVGRNLWKPDFWISLKQVCWFTLPALRLIEVSFPVVILSGCSCTCCLQPPEGAESKPAFISSPHTLLCIHNAHELANANVFRITS